MKLTLDEGEIRSAIIAYAKTLISIAPGTDIALEITAGRTNGWSATLDITPAPAKTELKTHRTVIVEDVAQPRGTAEPINTALVHMALESPLLTQEDKAALLRNQLGAALTPAQPEVITQQPYTPGLRQAVAEIPAAPVVAPVAEAKPATTPVRAKASTSPFGKPKATASAPEPAAAPVVTSEPNGGENIPVDALLTKIYGVDANGVEVAMGEDPLAGVMDDSLDQVGNQEEQVPEQEPETISEADTPEDVPAEEPEPAPTTTPKLGGLKFQKPAGTTLAPEAAPGTQKVSAFSKLHRQAAPETVEG